MGSLRTRLSWLVAEWITVQLAALCAVPLAVHAASPTTDEVVCTCPGSMPGAQCPMHKPGAGHHDDRDEPGRCAIRSASTQPQAMLLTLVASGAVPQSRFEAVAPDRTERLNLARTLFTSHVPLPEAPPPR